MLCKYCGNEVDESQLSCSTCGGLVEQEIQTPDLQEQPTPKKKKTKGWLIAVIALVLAAALGVGGWFGYCTWKYNRAIDLVAQKEYDQAMISFEQLDSFKDSADQAKTLKKQNRDYENAIRQLESGKYKDAQATFASLEDYRDSALYASYAQAQAELKNAAKCESLEACAEKFQALGDFLDSKDMAGQCYYQAARAAVRQELPEQLELYLGKLTQEQKTQFEESFQDEEVLKGWADALYERFVMESKYAQKGLQYDDELELLDEIMDLDCRQREISKLLEKYYWIVYDQKYNLDNYGKPFDWVKHYEYELQCLEILDQMNEKFGFLDDDEELKAHYIGKTEEMQRTVTIERELGEWAGSVQVKNNGNQYYVDYENTTGYDYTMHVCFIYYDASGKVMEQDEQMGSVRNGQNLRFYLDPPANFAEWGIGFTFDEYEEMDLVIEKAT